MAKLMFGLWTQLGQKNHVLVGDRTLHGNGLLLGTYFGVPAVDTLNIICIDQRQMSVCVCVIERHRPSTFPRGRCPVPVTTSPAASAVARTTCGCGAADCSAGHDQLPRVNHVLSRSASSSSSGIGSMSLCEASQPGAPALRPPPKCKYQPDTHCW